MKSGYLFLLVAILFASCKVENNTLLEYKKIKTVQLENSSGFIALGQQIAQVDGAETLILSCDDYKLRFYDLEKNLLIKEIKLDVAALDAFEFINKDSIFILYGNKYSEQGYIDTDYFVLMNYDGKVVKGFSIKNPLVWSNENQPISTDKAIYPTLSTNDIGFFENKVFFFLNKMNPKNIGSAAFIENASPIASFYDLSIDSLTVSNSLWYPGITEGVFYPSDFAPMYYTLSHNNLPLIRFYYTSKIYEWDYKEDKTREISMKTQFCDSILPLQYETTYSDNNIEGMYLQIHYDPYRELYFSIFLFSPDIYGMGVWTQMIYDKNFQLVSEIFQPEMDAFNPIFTENYIVNVSNSLDGQIRVNYWKLERSEENQEEYNRKVLESIISKKEKRRQILTQSNNSIENSGDKINSFTHSKFKIESKDYAIVSLNIDGGCPSCRQTILTFISENTKFFKERPFYLLIGGYDNQAIQKSINDYNLSDLNVFSDSIGVIKSLDKDHSRNPRLLIYKNNYQMMDSIFEPNDLETGLIPSLVLSLGGQVVNKSK